MVQAFRKFCPAPVISLRRGASEQMVDDADYHIEPDPEPLVALVGEIIQKKGRAESASVNTAQFQPTCSNAS